MSTSNKKDNKYQIAVIPGDGIGKEVMEATISVLDELNVDFDYVYGIAGDECNEEHGTPLPQETIDIVRDSDACLFGAAGETAADVIVKIRQEMKMFANLRPVKSYPFCIFPYDCKGKHRRIIYCKSGRKNRRWCNS